MTKEKVNFDTHLNVKFLKFVKQIIYELDIVMSSFND